MRVPVERSAERLVLFEWGVSSYFGWGVYGLNLMLAWGARRAAGQSDFLPVSLQRIDPAQLDIDPLDRVLIGPALERSAQVLDGLRQKAGQRVRSAHVVLHTINNGMARGRAAHDVDVESSRQAGVAFLDRAEVAPGALGALRKYPLLVAGSSWNRDLLREAGSERVELVLQGVDPSHFHPAPKRGLFAGQFVVFSGGKLEHRKGQDLVVQAFAIFAAKHPDTLLLAAWSSPWAAPADPFPDNPAVGAPPRRADGAVDVAAWAALNGIAAHQVVDVGAVPNRAMPRIMREADVGLFPSRAEGGTNLVAMECMACGVPAILSANTGHLDLLRAGAGTPLSRQAPVAGESYRGWGCSDVEEIVSVLEAVYTDRAESRAQGARAASAMAALSWAGQMDRLAEMVQSIV